MAGFLGVHELGASVVIINITAFLYMVPLGISFIASSLVGNCLGASKPKTAKIHTNVSTMLIF